MSFCGSRQNVSLRGSVPRERQQLLALGLTLLPALSPHSRRSSNRNHLLAECRHSSWPHSGRTQNARICRDPVGTRDGFRLGAL